MPDYLLSVNGNYAWVLDAKEPNETITYGGNVEQIYSYAIHPEIKVAEIKSVAESVKKR